MIQTEGLVVFILGFGFIVTPTLVYGYDILYCLFVDHKYTIIMKVQGVPDQPTTVFTHINGCFWFPQKVVGSI